jgi:hypothetical protein
MRQWSIVAALLAALAVQPYARAQSELPKEMQADRVHAEIAAALKSGNSELVLKKVGERWATYMPLLPADFYMEARSAAAANDLPRAKIAFEDYFALAKKSDTDYSEAKYQEARQIYAQVSLMVSAAAMSGVKACEQSAPTEASEKYSDYIVGDPESFCANQGRRIGLIQTKIDYWAEICPAARGDGSGGRGLISQMNDVRLIQNALNENDCPRRQIRASE